MPNSGVRSVEEERGQTAGTGWGDAAKMRLAPVRPRGAAIGAVWRAKAALAWEAEEAVADRRRRAHPRRSRSIGGTRKGWQVFNSPSAKYTDVISSGFNTPNLGGCLCHDTHREAFSRSARSRAHATHLGRAHPGAPGACLRRAASAAAARREPKSGARGATLCTAAPPTPPLPPPTPSSIPHP